MSEWVTGGVSGRTRYLSCIYDLKTHQALRVDGFQVIIASFYCGNASAAVGGGRLIWESGCDKARANGATVIDPDNFGGFDGTPATLGDLIAAQGEGDGSGCWKRASGEVNILMAGADPSGRYDSEPAFRALLGSAPKRIYRLKHVRVPDVDGGAVYFLGSVVDLGAGENVSHHRAGKTEIIMDRGVKITRRNTGPVNYDRGIDAARQRFDSAAFAVRGASQTLSGGFIVESAIGIYMGDDPNRTGIDLIDWKQNPHGARYVSVLDHCVIEKMTLENCGTGIYMESTGGIYFTMLSTVQFSKCQVGLRTHNLTERHQRDINGTVMDNVRATSCCVGYWLDDGHSRFEVVNAEDCRLGEAVPDRLNTVPHQLTGATAPRAAKGGSLFVMGEAGVHANFYNCEGTPVAVFAEHGGVNGEFYGHESKMYFPNELPARFFTGSYFIRDGLVYKRGDEQPADAPSWAIQEQGWAFGKWPVVFSGNPAYKIHDHATPSPGGYVSERYASVADTNAGEAVEIVLGVAESDGYGAEASELMLVAAQKAVNAAYLVKATIVVKNDYSSYLAAGLADTTIRRVDENGAVADTNLLQVSVDAVSGGALKVRIVPEVSLIRIKYKITRLV